MGQNLGVALDHAGVRNAVNAQAEDLTYEELIELDNGDQSQHEETDDEDVVVEKQTKELSYKNVAKILEQFDDACDMMTEADPNLQRSMALREGIQAATSTYREFLKYHRAEHEKKQKQKSMTDFFSKPKQ